MSESRSFANAVGLTILVCHYVLSPVSAQIRILDNFGDGDATDGAPLQWTPMTAYPGTYDASTGDYFLEPTMPNSIVASTVQTPSLSNISIRTRLRINEVSEPGNSADNAGLAVRFNGARPYLVAITVDGVVLIRDREQPIFDQAFTDLRPLEEDVFLQLDAFGNQLTAWAWREGQVPSGPLLTATDNTLTDGDFGVFFNSLPNSAPNATGPGSALFRWVQVSDEHIPIRALCDFSGDALCNVSDIDLMLALGPIASGIPATGNEQFDLNDDGTIDLGDQSVWLREAAFENGLGSPYKPGDANLDGVVDGQDFVIWNNSKFTAGLGWSQGNFNGDGFIDGLDFVQWNINKFTASDAMSVPEPSNVPLWSLIIGFKAYRNRHNKHATAC